MAARVFKRGGKAQLLIGLATNNCPAKNKQIRLYYNGLKLLRGMSLSDIFQSRTLLRYTYNINIFRNS